MIDNKVSMCVFDFDFFFNNLINFKMALLVIFVIFMAGASFGYPPNYWNNNWNGHPSGAWGQNSYGYNNPQWGWNRNAWNYNNWYNPNDWSSYNQGWGYKSWK